MSTGLKFERYLYKKKQSVLSFRRTPKPPEPRVAIFDLYSGQDSNTAASQQDSRQSQEERDDTSSLGSGKRKHVDAEEMTTGDNEVISAEEGNTANSDGFEFCTLQNMFPNLSSHKIHNALTMHGTLDEAADALSRSEEIQQPKRKRAKKIAELEETDETSSDSEASLGSDDEDSSEKDNPDIRAFFSNATTWELTAVPSCSEKKASKIEGQRPFNSWQEMSRKFQQAGLSFDQLVQGGKELLKERAMLDRLILECSRMSHRINSSLEDIGLEISTTSSKKKLEPPKLLNSSMQLKGYQLVGLKWLATLHEQQVNGILADQMGLGKTAQALAFIAHLVETGCEGPHAIIVPSSTTENWIRELSMWIPTVTYEYYAGMQRERSELRADILGRETLPNIIVASYATATSTSEDRKFFRKLGCHYLILDEGHMVKNFKSMRYQHLLSLQAERKLLLTGTPLQNNLVELISLLNFVMPEVFGQRFDGMRLLLSTDNKGNSVSTYEAEKIEQVKKVIEPFILRRLKEDVLKDLPRKIERLVHCDVTGNHDVVYQRAVDEFKKSSKLNSSSGLSTLMELRKAACHPLLVRQHYDDTKLTEITRDFCARAENSQSTHEYVFEDLTVMSDFEIHNLCQEHGYLSKHILDNDQILHSAKFEFLSKKLQELQNEGSRCLIFSYFTMMLDILEPFLKLKGYRYLRLDGQTPVAERQELIDKYNNDTEILVFLLSTKAGGMGINLTSANTVILHDIDYNPYNDKQAEDRCHRVGQTRDVTVYKLVSKGTIEEGIHECAEDKLRLGRDLQGVDETDVKENVLKWILQTVK